jgi:hypothetical protein
MVGFRLRRGLLRLHHLVGFGWILTLFFLVGFSRSLSTAVVSVSNGRPHRSASSATASSATAVNSNNENDGCYIPHYKWLIVGGGIHGVGIAARLVGEGKILESNDWGNLNKHLLVVDEHPSLLHSWKERTRATGMAFLRSSAGFHLDVPAQGLREFAGDYHTKGGIATAVPSPTRKKQPSKKDLRKAKNNRNKGSNPNGVFVGSDYQRPALELFNDHCDLVVDKYGLDDYFFKGRVESICCPSNNNGGNKAAPARVVIRTGSDAPTTTVSADNIVLAVGNDDPLFPEWATDLVSKNNKDNNNINHKIFHILQISDDADSSGTNDGDNGDDSNDEIGRPRVVAIIGGGISAVHKALQLTSVDNINNKKNTDDDGKKPSDVVVHIVSRHQVREQQFDTHQDWMMTDELAQRSLEKGGKGLTERQKEFRTLQAPAERREVIRRERIPGTVPTYMTRSRGGLEEAIADGKIRWHVAGVSDANDHADATAGESENGSTKANGKYQLNLTNGNCIIADEIILATGLGKRPPGHNIIHPLAEQANLPLSPCGYPLVDPSLQWKQHQQSSLSGNTNKERSNDDGVDVVAPLLTMSSKIYVSGGLAELELGPSARNIAGARMAAERIAAAA